MRGAAEGTFQRLRFLTYLHKSAKITNVETKTAATVQKSQSIIGATTPTTVSHLLQQMAHFFLVLIINTAIAKARPAMLQMFPRVESIIHITSSESSEGSCVTKPPQLPLREGGV